MPEGRRTRSLVLNAVNEKVAVAHVFMFPVHTAYQRKSRLVVAYNSRLVR
jgi:hypothetical protein